MSNAELVRRHLANVGKPEEEQDLTVYSPSVRVEFPYAPEGHTAVIEGVEGLSKFLGNIGRFTRDMALTEPRIVELGDWAVAEYHGDAVFLDTDLPYSQDYIVLTRIEGGQIVHMREYYDSIRVLRALGDL